MIGLIGHAIELGALDVLHGLLMLTCLSLLLGAAWVAANVHGRHRREQRERPPVAVQIERLEAEPHPLKVISGHRGPAPRERA